MPPRTPAFVRNRSTVADDRIGRTQGLNFRPSENVSTFDVREDPLIVGDAGIEAIRGELDEFLATIDSAAQDLVGRNRANEAQNLRVLGDRLKRTASTRGVSSEQIARQMSDVTNQVNARQGLFESKVMSDRLNRISNTISQKANLQRTEFGQGLQRGQFREQVLRNLESDRERPEAIPRSVSSRSFRPSSAVVRPQVSAGQRFSRSAVNRGRAEQLTDEFLDRNRRAAFLDERARIQETGRVTAGGRSLLEEMQGVTVAGNEQAVGFRGSASPVFTQQQRTGPQSPVSRSFTAPGTTLTQPNITTGARRTRTPSRLAQTRTGKSVLFRPETGQVTGVASPVRRR